MQPPPYFLLHPSIEAGAQRVSGSAGPSLEVSLGDLPRIILPRTLVNKLPVNAPNPSGWHHGCCCRTVEEERELARRRKLL
jgi:hypothetical protein